MRYRIEFKEKDYDANLAFEIDSDDCLAIDLREKRFESYYSIYINYILNRSEVRELRDFLNEFLESGTHDAVSP